MFLVHSSHSFDSTFSVHSDNFVVSTTLLVLHKEAAAVWPRDRVNLSLNVIFPFLFWFCSLVSPFVVLPRTAFPGTSLLPNVAFHSPATFFFLSSRSLGVFLWSCGRGSRPWTTQVARSGFSGVILYRFVSKRAPQQKKEKREEK